MKIAIEEHILSMIRTIAHTERKYICKGQAACTVQKVYSVEGILYCTVVNKGIICFLDYAQNLGNTVPVYSLLDRTQKYCILQTQTVHRVAYDMLFWLCAQNSIQYALLALCKV